MVALLYPLLKAVEGAIVNISSVHAVATSSDIASYAAEMLENALSHPEIWMASSSLMRRPLLPVIGRKKGRP